MRFLKRFFKSEIEVARVRHEKLAHWIDLQTRPQHKILLEQLQTNIDSLYAIISDIQAYVDSLHEFEAAHAKIHVKNLISEQKKIILRPLQEMMSQTNEVDTENILSLVYFYKHMKGQLDAIDTAANRVNEYFQRYIPKFALRLNDIIERLKQNLSQATDIIESPQNLDTISLKNRIMSYTKKLERKAQLEAQTLKYKEQEKQVNDQEEGLKRREQSIKNDPKFKIEKDLVKKPESKYRHSFYELDLMDIQSKISQMEQKRDILQRSILHTNEEIANLRLDKDLEQILTMIRSACGIQVEIVIDDE